MKNKIIPISIVTIFGLVVMSGLALAAARYNVTSTLGGTTGDYFDLDGHWSVQSIRVGSQGVGGVTFFNGTIVNQTVTDTGDDIPVTFGDNVRIDGEIYRTEVGGDYPIKVSDTIMPATDNTYSLGTSDNQFKDAYLAGNLSTGGTLGVTGATTLSSTLAVTGATTLTGALTTTGLVTANGGITMGDATTLTIGDGETLDVTSATVTGLSSDDVSDLASIAMLDEAETITGNWVNTANPWSAAEIADIERHLELPLLSFINATDEGLLTNGDPPSVGSNNNVAMLVWEDADTDWISQTFVVPADYASNGHFEVVAAESEGAATDVGVDFDVYVNQDNVALDAAATDQTRVDVGASTAPQILTLTVVTDFASLAADDIVTLRLTRADGGAGAEDLELYEARFVYTATQ